MDFVLNLEPYIGSLPDFCPTTLPSLNNWLKDVMGLICMNLYWVVTVEDRDLSKRNITPTIGGGHPQGIQEVSGNPDDPFVDGCQRAPA